MMFQKNNRLSPGIGSGLEKKKLPADDNKAGLLSLVILLCVVVCVVLLFRFQWSKAYLNQTQAFFQHYQNSSRVQDQWIAYGIFLTAGGLLVGIGLPRLWLSSVAGALFGLQWGLFLGLGASCAGAAVVYVIGRTFFHNRVEKLLTGRLAVWKTKFQANAFIWVLYARLFPFSNSTLVSLASGSCRAGFFPYLAASALGFIPLTVLACLVGNGSVHGHLLQIGIGLGGIVLIHLCLYLVKHTRSRQTREQE